MERKRTSGFPWHLWTALLVVAALVCTAYWLFPPTIQLSRVELTLHGQSSIVAFDATNHSQAPSAKTLRVTVFAFRPASKWSKLLYVPLDHRDISVILAPSETRSLRCEFVQTGSFSPGQAEVEILPDARSVLNQSPGIALFRDDSL